jgi:HK97 family phage major capsid protein
MKSTLIYEAIKKALVEGEAKITSNEASAITGSGSGVGGRVIYDDAFASARLENPLREVARQIPTIGSDEAFVVKTGNALDQTNPWGYTPANNTGSPDTAIKFWQIPVRVISAILPIRSAVLEDVNALEETVVADLMAEFSQAEAKSMFLNNDQSGTTTTTTGGTSGLRGLNSYAGSTSAASFGSNGSAITNGLHTVLQVAQATATSFVYDDIVNLQKSLPAQYLYKPTTCFMMHPDTIYDLRQLKAATTGNASRLFSELGTDDGGAVLYMFGHKVIPNAYMDTVGVGKYPIYLAEWDKFLTIADREEMTIKRFDQTYAGFVTLYAEKRMVSTIRDVFAGVRLYGA